MARDHRSWGLIRVCLAKGVRRSVHCHIDAFFAMGGAPSEEIRDCEKTTVIDQNAEGIVISDWSSVPLLNHHGA